MPSFERVENPLSGLSASFLQSAVCIICLQEADKFHTCSLRCILRQVHALTQNALTLFSADAENSAKLFLQSVGAVAFQATAPSLHIFANIG